MSYDDTPHYEREIFLKNRLDVLLKPIVGKLSGKNAPQIKLNDTCSLLVIDVSVCCVVGTLYVLHHLYLERCFLSSKLRKNILRRHASPLGPGGGEG
jgi:hypothetical protein